MEEKMLVRPYGIYIVVGYDRFNHKHIITRLYENGYVRYSFAEEETDFVSPAQVKEKLEQEANEYNNIAEIYFSTFNSLKDEEKREFKRALRRVYEANIGLKTVEKYCESNAVDSLKTFWEKEKKQYKKGIYRAEKRIRHYVGADNFLIIKQFLEENDYPFIYKIAHENCRKKEEINKFIDFCNEYNIEL